LRHVKTNSAEPALLVGLDAPDDAAVYRVTEDTAIVQTVDFFTPIVDDPFAWGRIAAANALSDIYAMGAAPVTALNLVGWPRDLDFELLGRVLEGGGEACNEAGVAIVGGHSVDDPEPKFGMSVTGLVHPEEIVRKTTAPAGSELVLTKPLGTGIISSAVKQRLASPEVEAHAVAVMSALNRTACGAMLEVGALAATDITGFGLIGHLLEMLGSTRSAELRIQAIPLLPGATDLVARGAFPGGSARNRAAARDRVDLASVDDDVAACLFDAQTSGGLLIACEADSVDRLLKALRARGVVDAAWIGTIVEGDGNIRVRP
jgi:selenide, water dikinase